MDVDGHGAPTCTAALPCRASGRQIRPNSSDIESAVMFFPSVSVLAEQLYMANMNTGQVVLVHGTWEESVEPAETFPQDSKSADR
jgi:hypothetical protein